LFENGELIGYIIWRLYVVWIIFWMTIGRECGGYWSSIYGRCWGRELVEGMMMINVVDGGVQLGD